MPRDFLQSQILLFFTFSLFGQRVLVVPTLKPSTGLARQCDLIGRNSFNIIVSAVVKCLMEICETNLCSIIETFRFNADCKLWFEVWYLALEDVTASVFRLKQIIKKEP